MGGALKHAPLPKPTETEIQFKATTENKRQIAIWGVADQSFEGKAIEKKATEFWLKFGPSMMALNELGTTSRKGYDELDKLAVKARAQEPYLLEEIGAHVGSKAAAGLAVIGKGIVEVVSLGPRIGTAAVAEIAERTDSPLVSAMSGIQKKTLASFDATFNPTLSDIADVATGAGEMNERIDKVFAKLEAAHGEYRAAARDLMSARDEVMAAVLAEDMNGAGNAAARLSDATDRFKSATKDLQTALYPVVSTDSELMSSYNGFAKKSEDFLKEIVVTVATTVTGISAARYATIGIAKGAGKLVELGMKAKGTIRAAEAGAALAEGSAELGTVVGQVAVAGERSVLVGQNAMQAALAAEKAAIAGQKVEQFAGMAGSYGRKVDKLAGGIEKELDAQEELASQYGISEPSHRLPAKQETQSAKPAEPVQQTSQEYWAGTGDMQSKQQ